MKIIVAPGARRDIDRTLKETGQKFGERQIEIYAAHIAHAFALLGDDPHRPGSKSRDDIRKGARSFRLALATTRRQAASHVIYYRVDKAPDGAGVVIILRFLHDRIEPAKRLR